MSAIFTLPETVIQTKKNIPTLFTKGFTEGSYSVELTNEQYHADRTAVSRSQIEHLLRSPSHFFNALRNPSHEQTAAQLLGTELHRAVLEPHLFDANVVAWRGGTKTGFQWRKFKEENKSKMILNADVYDQVIGMRDAVNGYVLPNNIDSTLKDVIVRGESEKTIFWRDEETGIVCRIRVDSLLKTLILDLKSCGDARPDSFLNTQAFKLNYDLQAAMYYCGVLAYTGKKMNFCFVAVETSQPHGVWLHETGPGCEFFENGMRKFRYLLKQLALCRQKNEWEPYTNSYSKLDKIPNRFIFAG